MKKIVAVLFLFSVFVLNAQSAVAYTKPGNPTGFVNDYAGILSKTEKDNLEQKLVSFQKNTGNEMAVVTIKSLGGDTIENFAVKLFEDWQIGVKGKDNGVLLLVAMDEHKIRIEVGYGLEPVLTDAQSSSVIRNIITPAFKNNDFAGGIDNAVDVVVSVIGGDASAVPVEGPDKDGLKTFGTFFVLGIFLLMWMTSILGRSKSWWAGGVLGGIVAIVLSIIFGFIYIGIIAFVLLIPIGLLFDFVVSSVYRKNKSIGSSAPWWIGGNGFGGGGGGGGFGGFGGGRSGGGGSSGGW